MEQRHVFVKSFLPFAWKSHFEVTKEKTPVQIRHCSSHVPRVRPTWRWYDRREAYTCCVVLLVTRI